MNEDLAIQLDRAGSPKLLVVGDTILDGYVWGEAARVSPEAPVIVLRADHDEVRLGGAASVAYLLRGLGAEVALAGVVGDDADGRRVRGLLAECQIEDLLVVDASRPTTSKERLMGRAAGGQPQQIVRVDREDDRDLSADLARRLTDAVVDALAGKQALLVSDYAKGSCAPGLLATVMRAAGDASIPVIVDPAKIADYSRYQGGTLLKPNRAEAELATRIRIRTPDDALLAARRIAEQVAVGAVLVTLDGDGMVLADAEGSARHFPTSPRSIYDITGAGDMALAVLGFGQATGLDLADTVRLANVAAGLEVERLGVAQVTRAELIAAVGGLGGLAGADNVPGGRRAQRRKLVSLDKLVELAGGHRRAGRRIVLTNGCFDLLHAGHVSYLQEAAALAELLIVAVNGDASVRRLKGAGRPVVGERDRAAMLAALECVDHVVIFDDDTPHEVLRRLRPDVLVKGGTYAIDQVVGREVVEAYGGCVRVVGAVPGISTSELIRRAAPIPESPEDAGAPGAKGGRPCGV